MKVMLIRLFLEVERRWHLVDAYLAATRGDMVERAECECRAYECERKLAQLEINK